MIKIINNFKLLSLLCCTCEQWTKFCVAFLLFLLPPSFNYIVVTTSSFIGCFLYEHCTLDSYLVACAIIV